MTQRVTMTALNGILDQDSEVGPGNDASSSSDRLVKNNGAVAREPLGPA
jgi:hypothetical protein